MNNSHIIVLLIFIFFKHLVIGEESLSNEIKVFSKQEGYYYAKELQSSSQWINLQSVVEGIQDFIAKSPPPQELSDEAKNEKYWQLWKYFYEQLAEKNLSQAISFLQDISRKPQMYSLEDGKLIYEIVEHGTGENVVKEGGTLLLHYVFTTLDGREIVSSRLQRIPVHVSLPDVIPGFAKGIVGMRKGEKRKLYIHPDLAYGKLGKTPPNILLIGEVELVDF